LTHSVITVIIEAMRLYLDIDKKEISSPGTSVPALSFKRRDNEVVELFFTRSGASYTLSPSATVRVGLKLSKGYDTEFLTHAALSNLGDHFYGELNFNTVPIEGLFVANPSKIPAMFEVEWLDGTSLVSSNTVNSFIYNDVIRGDEGTPAEIPTFYTVANSDTRATEADALAGVDNLKWMSPLRVAQAVAAIPPAPHTHDERYYTEAEIDSKLLGLPILGHTHNISDTVGLQAALDSKQAAGSYADASHTHDYADLTDVPTEFTPSAHTHEIADTTGLQAALDSKQAAGSYADASHTHDYADLTDVPTEFTPSAHTHEIADTTGLQAALDSKQAAGSYADASHTHDYADLTDVPTEFTPSAHTHEIADTTGLQAALDSKQAAGSYADASHTHEIADTTGLQAALDSKQAAGSYADASHTHDYADLTGVPTEFTPSAHTHEIADTTGLQAALDSIQAAGSYADASHTHDYADLTGVPTEFTPSAHTHEIADTTGLQAALDSKQAAGSYADASHTHALSDLADSGATAGQVATYNGTAWVPQNSSGGTGGVSSYNDLTDVPTEFTPSAHTHEIADTTGLQAALDSKQAAGSYADASHTHDYADLTDVPTEFTPSAHTHEIADTTGLQAALDSKQAAGSYADASHTHDYADLTDVPTEFTPSAHTHDYADLTGVPTEFTPSAHTHGIADTTCLQAALDSKQAAGSYADASHTHDYADLADKPTEFPPAAHAHELADVTGLETALLGKAATTHTHTQSDITGLETALLGKANATHTHPLSDLPASGATTGQVPTFNGTSWVPQDALAGVTSYLDLTNVPSTFPPATHTHTISDVTGLETALDGKQAAGAYLTATGGITTIAVVASMPATPSATTLYIVTT
jgi:hypothetical protein